MITSVRTEFSIGAIRVLIITQIYITAMSVNNEETKLNVWLFIRRNNFSVVTAQTAVTLFLTSSFTLEFCLTFCSLYNGS